MTLHILSQIFVGADFFVITIFGSDNLTVFYPQNFVGNVGNSLVVTDNNYRFIFLAGYGTEFQHYLMTIFYVLLDFP